MKKLSRYSSNIMLELEDRLQRLYGKKAEDCLNRLEQLIGRYGVGIDGKCVFRRWDQRDALLITYADMVSSPSEPPLVTLNRFLKNFVGDIVNTVHILPFFPYSSDDGFSVVDYRAVHADYGNWEDVQVMSEQYNLMFDLVINHVSRKSAWFKNYELGMAPERNYFIAMDPDTDVSEVVRPRSSPLLTSTRTRNGERFLWTTFSDDQIDLNFANPDVLFEFLDILYYYIARGARVIRLDAIAYLWKKIGTTCIHLSETHEIVKMIRTILDMVAPEVLVLTETNVPHEENISYFGKGDEAHLVYQFSLPPLLLHALQTGNGHYLTQWALNLDDIPRDCAYLNFTASHDGIGVRPLEGLIPDTEYHQLLERIRALGGRISMKRNSDGSESPYELNITYFNALGEPHEPAPTDLHLARFICSQTIAMSLKGIPAIYFNSLVVGQNNDRGVQETGRARTINRGKWDLQQLSRDLDDGHTIPSRIYKEYSRLLKLRSSHPAFHPDGPQEVYAIRPELFVLQRRAPEGTEDVLSVSNMTSTAVHLDIQKEIPGCAHIRKGHDLIKEQDHDATGGALTLAPYQTSWFVCM